MKVIGIVNNYKPHSSEKFLGIYLMSDSTLLKDGKPFFVPDFTSKITFHTSLVIRVNRLGKNISKQFAHRYYDAVTIGMALKAEDIEAELIAQNAPTNLSTSFDGAAILGKFVPIQDVTEIKYSLNLNDKLIICDSSENLCNSFDDIIVFLSKYYTLKIGDIIFTGFNDIKENIQIGQQYTGKINNTPVLNFKTK